jgi:TRAP-type C4-dicarboxylate transport system substrate-binding protein
MPEDMRRVVVDGFAQLQQATFASPKRKSIQAYQDFTAAGGEIYVPNPEEMTAFSDAVQPVYEWFATNVDGGDEVLGALRDAVTRADDQIQASYAVDLN